MIILETDDKVNFVDQNNVLLGYSLMQNRCGHADWFINEQALEKCPIEIKDLKGINGLSDYNFDVKYFKRIEESEDYSDIYRNLECGGMVIFRITEGVNEKFIHIFNSHNGYYSHGFEFKEGNECLKEGCL